MFIYEDAALLSGIEGNYEIGFDAGDGVRRATLFRNTHNENSLDDVNIYRIDGEGWIWKRHYRSSHRVN